MSFYVKVKINSNIQLIKLFFFHIQQQSAKPAYILYSLFWISLMLDKTDFDEYIFKFGIMLFTFILIGFIVHTLH